MPKFVGADYQPERDDARLTTQPGRTWTVMQDGHWHTLREISSRTGDPEASVSAQLRHLRKPEFGSHLLDREYLDHGLYRYRIREEEFTLCP